MDNKIEIKGICFKKSSFSPRNVFRLCVGVAITNEKVYVTNTSSNQPIIEFSHDEWDAFIKGVKAGEFEVE